jgi:hypothetical protein
MTPALRDQILEALPDCSNSPYRYARLVEVWRHAGAEWAAPRGLQRAGGYCRWSRLWRPYRRPRWHPYQLYASPPEPSPFPCHLPGDDHCSMWRCATDPSWKISAWVTQPYLPALLPLAELDAVATRFGLAYAIDAPASWHYPGMTTLICWTRR